MFYCSSQTALYWSSAVFLSYARFELWLHFVSTKRSARLATWVRWLYCAFKGVEWLEITSRWTDHDDFHPLAGSLVAWTLDGSEIFASTRLHSAVCVRSFTSARSVDHVSKLLTWCHASRLDKVCCPSRCLCRGQIATAKTSYSSFCRQP